MGMLRFAAKSPSVGAASEYSTPPPEMMRGFLAALMTEAAWEISRGSACGRLMKWTCGSKNIAG